MIYFSHHDSTHVQMGLPCKDVLLQFRLVHLEHLYCKIVRPWCLLNVHTINDFFDFFLNQNSDQPYIHLLGDYPWKLGDISRGNWLLCEERREETTHFRLISSTVIWASSLPFVNLNSEFLLLLDLVASLQKEVFLSHSWRQSM